MEEALGNKWTSRHERQVGAHTTNWINKSEAVVFVCQANKKRSFQIHYLTWISVKWVISLMVFLKFLQCVPTTPAVKPNVSGNTRSKAGGVSMRKMDPRGRSESFENRKSACPSLVLWASSYILACYLLEGTGHLQDPLWRPFHETKSSVWLLDLQESLVDAQEIFTGQTNVSSKLTDMRTSNHYNIGLKINED